jgi:hypothetical protein
MEARIGASKTTSELTATKTVQQTFALPYTHFIEHLTDVIEKSPRTHNEKLQKLEPLIRWLTDKTGFHLEETSPNCEPKTAVNQPRPSEKKLGSNTSRKTSWCLGLARGQPLWHARRSSAQTEDKKDRASEQEAGA